MKKLLDQIVKFGIVGFICFFIDYLVGLGVMNLIKAVFGQEAFVRGSMIGSVAGFVVSVIVNYILSFKFVFTRKEDMNRGAEFIIFIILSVIGMGLNSFLIWIVVGPLYESNSWLAANVGNSMMYTGAKVFATAVVMVYNFVTRKIFLEQKDK
ncbi:MAG: GtrA family protein [Pseudobutyrivibrio sp.]|nr:GtrA family protein [Pseudobutyrivibrio sp.]